VNVQMRLTHVVQRKNNDCASATVAKGVNYLALAVIFILMSFIPLSYAFLVLGAHIAEIGMDVRPRQS
jgi:hypothetical protein